MVLLSTVSQCFDTVLQCFWHCFTITLRYSGALPDDSADAAPSEAELYEDLDFGDQSPIDYYEDEEMSEGDIADD